MEILVFALALLLGVSALTGNAFPEENDARTERELKRELLKQLKDRK